MRPIKLWICGLLTAWACAEKQSQLTAPASSTEQVRPRQETTSPPPSPTGSVPKESQIQADAWDREIQTPSAESLQSLRWISKPTFFAISGTMQNGLTVSVHAVREALPAQPSTNTAPGTTVNEGIQTATWRRAGVSYAVDFECQRQDDRRCQTPRELLDFISQWTVVQPRRQGL